MMHAPNYSLTITIPKLLIGLTNAEMALLRSSQQQQFWVAARPRINEIYENLQPSDAHNHTTGRRLIKFLWQKSMKVTHSGSINIFITEILRCFIEFRKSINSSHLQTKLSRPQANRSCCHSPFCLGSPGLANAKSSSYVWIRQFMTCSFDQDKGGDLFFPTWIV